MSVFLHFAFLYRWIRVIDDWIRFLRVRCSVLFGLLQTYLKLLGHDLSYSKLTSRTSVRNIIGLASFLFFLFFHHHLSPKRQRVIFINSPEIMQCCCQLLLLFSIFKFLLTLKLFLYKFSFDLLPCNWNGRI